MGHLLRPRCRRVLRGVLLLLLGAANANVRYRSPRKSACGDFIRVVDGEGGNVLLLCQDERNEYHSQYHHEAMALPPMAILGPRAQRVLILGGADLGVATQVLKFSPVSEVVLVSQLTDVTEVSRKYLKKISAAYGDERLKLVRESPRAWLAKQGRRLPHDLVILERGLPGEGLKELVSTDHSLLASFAREGDGDGDAPQLFVIHGGSIWDLLGLQTIFNELRSSFGVPVSPLQYSSVTQSPWHEVIFLVGARDVLSVDWGWWREQDVPSLYYHPGLHEGLFVPAAMVSRALGFRVPAQADVHAAMQHAGQSVQEAATSSWKLEIPPPEAARRELLRTRTKFQELVMYSVLDADETVTVMELDDELQVTSRFADFYHEGLVHPAMAALGARARRALVIGGGDGGVATVLLRYPAGGGGARGGLQRVVQLEIDEAVVNASKELLPLFASGYRDPRHELHIVDAVDWVKSTGPQYVGDFGTFDLCIIDSTDEPLESLWNAEFLAALKRLLAPHAAVVQNIGTNGPWMWSHYEKLANAFDSVRLIPVISPEYPSPYYQALSTDSLDPLVVDDWNYWSASGMESIYYHPSLHRHLFTPAREVLEELRRRGSGSEAAGQPQHASYGRHATSEL